MDTLEASEHLLTWAQGLQKQLDLWVKTSDDTLVAMRTLRDCLRDGTWDVEEAIAVLEAHFDLPE